MLTEQEFQAAMERHLDTVYRVALNAVRTPVDAEDAVQTAMLRLWQTDTVFENDDHLRHWLIRVTVNVCRDFLRAPWRRCMVSLESCAEPMFRDTEKESLFREVMALPVKYRLPVYLYYYVGYSAAEVGKILRLNPSTVQTRLARGREKLKRQLEE